jgi:hypothetical protein
LSHRANNMGNSETQVKSLLEMGREVIAMLYCMS